MDWPSFVTGAAVSLALSAVALAWVSRGYALREAQRLDEALDRVQSTGADDLHRRKMHRQRESSAADSAPRPVAVTWRACPELRGFDDVVPDPVNGKVKLITWNGNSRLKHIPLGVYMQYLDEARSRKGGRRSA